MNFFKSLFGYNKKESMRVEDCLVRQINSFSRRLYISWSDSISGKREKALLIAEGGDHLRYIHKWFGDWEEMLKICITLDLEDNARWIIEKSNMERYVYYIALQTACLENKFKYIRMLAPLVDEHMFGMVISNNYFSMGLNVDNIREILDIALEAGIRANFSFIIGNIVQRKRFDIADMIMDYEKRK